MLSHDHLCCSLLDIILTHFFNFCIQSELLHCDGQTKPEIIWGCRSYRELSSRFKEKSMVISLDTKVMVSFLSPQVTCTPNTNGTWDSLFRRPNSFFLFRASWRWHLDKYHGSRKKLLSWKDNKVGKAFEFHTVNQDFMPIMAYDCFFTSRANPCMPESGVSVALRIWPQTTQLQQK